MRLSITSNLNPTVDVLQFEIRKVSDYRTRVGKPPASLWDHVAHSWRLSRRRMFETAGVSAGTPWPSYDETGEADWYKWYKAIVYGNGRPLTLFDVLRWRGTDYLMRSFTEKNAPGYVERHGPAAFLAGSSLPYARTNSEGIGVAPRRLGGHPIPRRPLDAIGGDLRVALRENLIRYANDFGTALGDKLDGAGARMLPLAR